MASLLQLCRKTSGSPCGLWLWEGMHAAWRGDLWRPQATWSNRSNDTWECRVGAVGDARGRLSIWGKLCGAGIGRGTWQNRGELCGAGMGDVWSGGAVGVCREMAGAVIE